MKNSKQLKNNDISGYELNNFLFENNQFSDKLLSFDRIQKDYRDNSYIIFEHIKINDNIEFYNDLPEEVITHIEKLLLLKNKIINKSSINTKLWIDFYFSKDENKEFLYFLFPNNQIKKINLNKASFYFRKLNFYGIPENKNKSFKLNFYNSSIVKNSIEDDSSFSLTKALLQNDFTYGFNLDNLIIDKNRIDIYEYLLCDEKQKVSPFTSHPNRYFNKNKDKFLSLYNFSQSTDANLYLINYAKENTIHSDKIKFMKVVNINPYDKRKNYVDTIDKNTYLNYFKRNLEKKYLSQISNKKMI